MKQAEYVEPCVALTGASLLLTVGLKERLKERAFAEGRSQSEIAREVLTDYLNRFEWPESKA